jgi:hypothetical protein
MKLLHRSEMMFTITSKTEDEVMRQLSEYLNNMFFAN